LYNPAVALLQVHDVIRKCGQHRQTSSSDELKPHLLRSDVILRRVT